MSLLFGATVAFEADDIARYVRCQFIAVQRLPMGLAFAFHVDSVGSILVDLILPRRIETAFA